MKIERKAKEIIIRIPASVSIDDLQEFINYVRYKELTSKTKTSQNQVDTLSRKVNKNWWKKNRTKLLSGINLTDVANNDQKSIG